ncbi:hypothetical protein KKC91_00055 [bacterium]|nr:hypothetical protein [bacterium]
MNSNLTYEKRAGEDRREKDDTGYKGPERRTWKDRRMHGGKKKSPVSALIVSLVVPGAGQFYNRELIRGILLAFLAVTMVLWFGYLQIQYNQSYEEIVKMEGAKIAMYYARSQVAWRLIPLICYLVTAIFSAYDAFVFARYVKSSMR